MTQAYIVDALRTPTGRRKGSLSHVHAADLGAHVLKTLVERNGIPDEEYVTLYGMCFIFRTFEILEITWIQP